MLNNWLGFSGLPKAVAALTRSSYFLWGQCEQVPGKMHGMEWCTTYTRKRESKQCTEKKHIKETKRKHLAFLLKECFVDILSSNICNCCILYLASSILCTYLPGEFLFQYPLILPSHTVHGVLQARILKWFAIPFSSGPHPVRPLHRDPSISGGPTRHGLVSLS